MDKLTSAQRHKNMSHIRSTETSPEKEIRSALHRIGFRFRKNDRRLAGCPDIVLPHYYAAIFVNGCFWHAHGWSGVAGEDSKICSKFHFPKTNQEFWRSKFMRNKERDKKEIDELLEQGWRVGIVWECSIRGRNRSQKIEDVAESITLWLEEEFDKPFMEF